MEKGDRALALLKESEYPLLRQKAMEEGCVCHGEYNQHNVLMVRKKTAVTSFEHWGFDIQMADLYRFMRKILEKYNWDVRLGMEMLHTYHKIKEISPGEWQNLRIRVSVSGKILETGKLLLFTQQGLDFGKKHAEAQESEQGRKRPGKILRANVSEIILFDCFLSRQG